MFWPDIGVGLSTEGVKVLGINSGIVSGPAFLRTGVKERVKGFTIL